MDEKIIKRIELDLDGVGISLTPEQARKLHGALAELLGIKAEKEYVPVPNPIPYPQPYPVPVRPWRRPYEPYWTHEKYRVTCGEVPMTYNVNSGTVKMLVKN